MRKALRQTLGHVVVALINRPVYNVPLRNGYGLTEKQCNGPQNDQERTCLRLRFRFWLLEMQHLKSCIKQPSGCAIDLRHVYCWILINGYCICQNIAMVRRMKTRGSFAFQILVVAAPIQLPKGRITVRGQKDLDARLFEPRTGYHNKRKKRHHTTNPRYYPLKFTDHQEYMVENLQVKLQDLVYCDCVLVLGVPSFCRNYCTPERQYSSTDSQRT
jgi:hypothetical protein